jgi:hypothetical protein
MRPGARGECPARARAPQALAYGYPAPASGVNTRLPRRATRNGERGARALRRASAAVAKRGKGRVGAKCAAVTWARCGAVVASGWLVRGDSCVESPPRAESRSAFRAPASPAPKSSRLRRRSGRVPGSRRKSLPDRGRCVQSAEVTALAAMHCSNATDRPPATPSRAPSRRSCEWRGYPGLSTGPRPETRDTPPCPARGP